MYVDVGAACGEAHVEPRLLWIKNCIDHTVADDDILEYTACEL